jgi:hypothetical protein
MTDRAMKLLLLTSLLIGSACSCPKGTLHATREVSGFGVAGTVEKNGEKVDFAFHLPESGIVESARITRYRQTIHLAGGGEISGGKPAGGHIAFDEAKRSADIRLLELAPCSCRHLQEHSINGGFNVSFSVNGGTEKPRSGLRSILNPFKR